jgi:hypothetical protein
MLIQTLILYFFNAITQCIDGPSFFYYFGMENQFSTISKRDLSTTFTTYSLRPAKSVHFDFFQSNHFMFD